MRLGPVETATARVGPCTSEVDYEKPEEPQQFGRGGAHLRAWRTDKNVLQSLAVNVQDWLTSGPTGYPLGIVRAAASADRILVLEDEPSLVEVLGTYLRADGYIVSEDFVGFSGPKRALAENSALVILDLNLPKRLGSDVFRQLRRGSDVPVIVLTSWIGETDRILGLDLGADDYIGKPFSPREVVARVRSVLHRSRRDTTEPGSVRRGIQHVGALEIDREAHEVRRRGIAIPLTPTEFRILETLASHLGQALTREQLIERTARDGDIYDRTLDRHVGNLRQKIEDDPANPKSILTVHTIGYKMVGTR